MADYSIVLPVRDEEKFLERIIACIAAQTTKPKECVFVDDGSTDGGAAVLRRHAERFLWMRVLTLPDRGVRQRGPGVVNAFYQGMALLDHSRSEFLVKLDADLSFESTYFEDLLRRFAADPQLGIASGSLFVPNGGRWVQDRAPCDRTWGPSKMYRRTCFEQIGGIVPYMGWDAIDDFKAQSLGWRTRTFPDLRVLHYRPVGKRSGAFNAGVEHGRANYCSHSHPLFVLVRSAYRMFVDKPFLVAGAGILFGYWRASVLREPRVQDEDLARFVHRYQMSRLLHLGSR